MIQILPKILLSVKLTDYQNVIINEKINDYQTQSLDLLSKRIKPLNIIETNNNQKYFVLDALIPQVDYLQKWKIEVLREFLDYIDLETPIKENRIYLSRAKQKSRKIINEIEFYGSLRDHGFRRIFLEDYSFENQIQLFNNAEYIIAPHGAGLTNIVFCKNMTFK